MSDAPSNESYDGSPAFIRLDSSNLVWFDPLALDMLGDMLRSGAPFDLGEWLKKANTYVSGLACVTMPEFRSGVYKLDPRAIEKCEDSDDSERERYTADQARMYLRVDVESGALIFADATHLERLVTLLSWDEYDRSFKEEGVLTAITDKLGGPYFAVVISDSQFGMPFDGDGTYTIKASSVVRTGD